MGEFFRFGSMVRRGKGLQGFRAGGYPVINGEYLGTLVEGGGDVIFGRVKMRLGRDVQGGFFLKFPDQGIPGPFAQFQTTAGKFSVKPPADIFPAEQESIVLQKYTVNAYAKMLG